MNLEQKIEAVLFWRGEPMSHKRLGEILKVDVKEVREAIANLKTGLSGRGVVLIENNDEVALGTSPDAGKIIENLQKEEINKDLSKASLEILSIVLYKNGANRAEIDYIRGVNSSFILRALSVRGLIERVVDPNDSRRYLYKPSFDLLSYMGIKSVEELPEYSEIKNSINIEAQNSKEEGKEI